VPDPERVRVDLRARAVVARQRHREIGRAVIGAIARDHEAARLVGCLAQDLDRVLVGVRATGREEHPAACKSRQLEQALASAARGAAPHWFVTKQSCVACSRMAAIKAGC
jgi:hypothetical protein